ncbi:ORF23 [Betabaculovirus altermyunipunctae]|uniref:ORF23 n=1 Tax=Betabaculovirus altermyunipunctae TaxID=3051996 RepID=A0A1S5YDW1_9BBAC|nr:ORF23 [Betabaculovirus altermyunipunctae]AQQ80290.1 ORF23 [Betabaculovirus altermyunipunctae]
MQEYKMLRNVYQLFLFEDARIFRNKGVNSLQNSHYLLALLYRDTVCIQAIIQSLLALHKSVMTRLTVTGQFKKYIDDLQSFLQMYYYLHDKTSSKSKRPDPSIFTYDDKPYFNDKCGFYYKIKYATNTSEDSEFFKFVTDSENTFEQFFEPQLFPKRTGGQYSYSKIKNLLPDYAPWLGFQVKSHYLTLQKNVNIFDDEDLAFIKHYIFKRDVYNRSQLRRLLFKYHPDKNQKYSKVSAILLAKCKAMLKRCNV